MKRMLEERDVVITVNDITEVAEMSNKYLDYDADKQIAAIDCVSATLRDDLIYQIEDLLDKFESDYEEQQQWTDAKLDEEELQNIKDGWRR